MEVNGINSNVAEIEKNLKFPFKIEKFDDAALQKISKHFEGEAEDYIHTSQTKNFRRVMYVTLHAKVGESDFWSCFKIGPLNFVMPQSFVEHDLDELYNFEARLDDVYICTYMRSGTTWTQEMIWLICNDLNYEAAKATGIDERFPYFEMYTMFSKDFQTFPRAIDVLSKMTSKRFIKSHMPISYLPPSIMKKGCKIVYVARNPKDVAVSYYHFAKDLTNINFTADFEVFVDCFMENLLLNGSYFEHIKDGWNHRHDKNVLFLFYEDLVMDLKKSLQKLADFLERPINDGDLSALIEHLNVKSFKDNSSVNKEHLVELKLMNQKTFIRRGKVGGNPEITPEIAQRFDDWTEQQLMGSDLKFPYELRHKIEMYKLNANSQFKK